MTRVIATTVTFHDSAANSHKFYRAYVVGTVQVFQWGRIGAAGQWSADECRSIGLAERRCDEKIDEKMSGGYRDRQVVEFDYSGHIDPANKDTLRPLHDAHTAAAARKTAPAPAAPAPAAPPTPDPIAQPTDRHGEFTARALAAISLAVTDQPAAMAVLAQLREDWSELEEIHERAQSYLATLSTMLLATADA